MKSRSLLVLTVLLLAMFGVTGCITAPLSPELGLLVTTASYPHPQACPNGELGSRSGESAVVTVLWLVSVGDASVEKAARSAGIKKIMTIDHNYLNVLGIFSRYSTIVTGE